MSDSKLAENNPVAQKYWKRVIKTEGCWLWTGGTIKGGYGDISHGRTKFNRGQHLAHRVSWEIHFGQIPEGLSVLHHCDNPPCSNPDHLFLGTQADNRRDMIQKNRNAKGEMFPQSKLTADSVLEIRKRFAMGVSQKALWKEFGVSKGHMNDVVHRKKWTHIL